MTTADHAMLRCAATRLLVGALAVALMCGGLAPAALADAITDDNVAEMVEAAKTPADHEALAAYFNAKSEQALASVKRHEKMSNAFSGKQRPSWEAHCSGLIRGFKEQAKDYAALAREQAALAK
ncbi:MAG: hypothetical protein ACRERC_23920 [Candidatus Binatia bacterium]